MGANKRKSKSAAPRRKLLATVAQTTSPPSTLPEHHIIARIAEIKGTHLYSVQVPRSHAARIATALAATPDKEEEEEEDELLLVELPARFRNTIYLRLGSLVVVDTARFDARENKLDGEIENIVRDVKRWRRCSFWPPEFGAGSILLASASASDSSSEKEEEEEEKEEGKDSRAGKRDTHRPKEQDEDEEEGEYYDKAPRHMGQMPPSPHESDSE